MTKLVTIIEKTHFIIEFLELNLSLFWLDNNGMYNKSAFPTGMVSELKQKSFVVGDEALLGWQKTWLVTMPREASSKTIYRNSRTMSYKTIFYILASVMNIREQVF